MLIFSLLHYPFALRIFQCSVGPINFITSALFSRTEHECTFRHSFPIRKEGKPMKKTYVILIAALIILAAVIAPVAACPEVKKLATPKLVSPTNFAKMTNDDYLVTLTWKPVDDSRLTGYLVEVDGYSIPWDYWWFTSSTQRITTDSSYQVDLSYFISKDLENGHFKYRWRVTALASDTDYNSKPSQWRYFSFPEPKPSDKLPPIRLISPANNIKVREGTSLNYNWVMIPKSVDRFTLIHQKMEANKEWKYDTPTTILDSAHLPYASSQWQTTKGIHRWRVYTSSEGGALSMSPWRFYTVV